MVNIKCGFRCVLCVLRAGTINATICCRNETRKLVLCFCAFSFYKRTFTSVFDCKVKTIGKIHISNCQWMLTI